MKTDEYAQKIVDLVNAAVLAETERCAAVVQAAQSGDIDQDFRTIIHFIENYTPLPE